jgi:P-type conjugative transfer protein TrbJ
MNPSRRHLFLAGGAAAFAPWGLAPAAHAQTMVYDPAAVAQALKQVSQGLEQIQALKDQLTQQAQMIAKLGIDVTGPLGQIAAEATGLLKQAQGIGYSALDLSKSFAQLYPSDLAGMSPKDLAAKLLSWSQASRQTLQEAMAVQNQIAQAQPTTAAAVRAAVSASQDASGQTGAVQATNQLLAALSVQLAQLQTLLMTQSRQAETYEAERRAVFDKAEAERLRNATLTRRPRRFSGDSV